MIYTTDFIELAGKIGYIDLAKYLSDLGWVEYTGRVKIDTKIYQKTLDDELYQVNLPFSRDFADYNNAIYKAIEALAKTEKKSVEQLILELLNPLSDIIRVRMKSATVESGSIFVEEAIRLFDNTKKMLMATTQDISSPKTYHRGRASEKVLQFIENCRFGQTEIGSYVISLVCPFSVITDTGVIQLSLFTEEQEAAQSTTRKATNKLIRSIAKIKQQIDDSQNLENLVIDEQDMISVNFLESVSNLNLDKCNTEIEISVKWAPTITENRTEVDSLSITHDYYTPIKTVVDKYKAKEKEILTVVTGKISDLKASPNTESRKNGTIKIRYIGDNITKTKVIEAKLDVDSYNIAIAAHGEGKLVRVSGENEHGKLNNCSIEIIE